ncbi:MAG: hypothetical protein ACO3D9_03985 [Ilumatobacteraceae bacterium]
MSAPHSSMSALNAAIPLAAAPPTPAAAGSRSASAKEIPADVAYASIFASDDSPMPRFGV